MEISETMVEQDDKIKDSIKIEEYRHPLLNELEDLGFTIIPIKNINVRKIKSFEPRCLERYENVAAFYIKKNGKYLSCSKLTGVYTLEWIKNQEEYSGSGQESQSILERESGRDAQIFFIRVFPDDTYDHFTKMQDLGISYELQYRKLEWKSGIGCVAIDEEFCEIDCHNMKVITNKLCQYIVNKSLYFEYK